MHIQHITSILPESLSQSPWHAFRGKKCFWEMKKTCTIRYVHTKCKLHQHWGMLAHGRMQNSIPHLPDRHCFQLGQVCQQEVEGSLQCHNRNRWKPRVARHNPVDFHLHPYVESISNHHNNLFKCILCKRNTPKMTDKMCGIATK